MINQLLKIMPKALLLLILFGWPATALAEPFETIVNNGSPHNRVDIAIVGDGYTASQMQQYKNDVQNFIQGVFAQEPYREYARYYNVHRIDVISNESGADHPERFPSVFVDTAFDATYNCQGIQRFICVNIFRVESVIGNSLPASHADVMLVIVNDTEYGGSGGTLAAASTNSAAIELILHEVGHSFGLLADEYTDAGAQGCNPNFEPHEVNVTRETTRALIKWDHWIAATTPVPTTTPEPGVPGLYEGAKYCNFGLYRPTFDSKMRTLGRPFEQINTQQHIRRIYNFVSPIDSSQPLGDNITVMQGQMQQFNVTTPIPLTHTLTVTWLVDGQPQGNGQTFNLDSGAMSIGPHLVEALVSDGTPMVRSDPQQLLSERRSWSVTVQCPSALSASSQFFTMTGGSGSINITTQAGCGWTATSDVGWMEIVSANQGIGSKTVAYIVRENFTASARMGTLTIAGLTFTVIQDGGSGASCNYAISQTFKTFNTNGGTDSINITSSPNCAWQATSNVDWITITSGRVGMGNGTVTYSVTTNTSATGRDGKITIGGKIFLVKQQGS